MTVPDPSGCPWPLDPACLEEEWESDYDDQAQARAVALASSTLFRLCAYRVGGCPVQIRPCGTACYNGFTNRGSTWGRPFVPLNWNGVWSNGCGCSAPCRHQTGAAVQLPPPAWEILEVTVDGTVVDPSRYWLDDGYLIGLSGQTWPQTQNLDLPLTQANTFGVTYHNTAPVDGQGAYAAARLAVQYARACAGGTCDLPDTVTSIVRQGVSYEIPAGAFPNGETGIREVDAFIALWNPSHRKSRTTVWSP